MVYVTGDCHADFRKFSTDRFPDQKEMTRDDIVIVCGDFGIWDNSNEEKYWLKWLNEKPFTTVFVDGNHECLHKDTEILTDSGWVSVVEIYNNIDKYLVASVNLETGKLTYSHPVSKTKGYSDTLILFNGSNFSQCVTPGHDILISGKKMKAKDVIGMDIREQDLRFKVTYDQDDFSLSDDLVRLITFVVMDGTIVDYSKKNPCSQKMRIQFHLKKQRKISRIKELLGNCNIHFTEREYDGSVYINIYGEFARKIASYLDNTKEFPTWLRSLSKRQFKILLESILETDGTANNNCLYWRTTSKHNVDIISELCVKYNYDLNVRQMENASGYGSDTIQYKVSIKEDKRLDHVLDITEILYHDSVYCLTMHDGTLVTRYNLLPCITGNCFDRLYSDEFPIVDFHGGKAHKIRPHIFHLMRGYMFTFDGKKFWCFGGASSHDIDDGILDADDFETPQAFYAAIKQGYKYGKQFRINHISWWEQELPSQEEMNFGMKTLEENNFETDFVISHCCPQDVASALGFHGADRLTMYFNEVASRTKFNRWYFGHYHGEESVWGKFILHYDKIERIV